MITIRKYRLENEVFREMPPRIMVEDSIENVVLTRNDIFDTFATDETAYGLAITERDQDGDVKLHMSFRTDLKNKDIADQWIRQISELISQEEDGRVMSRTGPRVNSSAEDLKRSMKQAWNVKKDPFRYRWS